MLEEFINNLDGIEVLILILTFLVFPYIIFVTNTIALQSLGFNEMIKTAIVLTVVEFCILLLWIFL